MPWPHRSIRLENDTGGGSTWHASQALTTSSRALDAPLPRMSLRGNGRRDPGHTTGLHIGFDQVEATTVAALLVYCAVQRTRHSSVGQPRRHGQVRPTRHGNEGTP